MEYSYKEIMAAAITFKKASEKLLRSNHDSFEYEINQFIYITEEDRVIHAFVKPFLERKIDFSTIEEINEAWLCLNLPYSIDERIAYVLQTMYKSYNREIYLKAYTYLIFRDVVLEANIYHWNQKIIKPCLSELNKQFETWLDILRKKKNIKIEEHILLTYEKAN